MLKKHIPYFLAILAVGLFFAGDAWAGPGTGGSLPYEDWVRQK